jgi:hypothetical protein
MRVGDFAGADKLRGQGDKIAEGLTSVKSGDRLPFSATEQELIKANVTLNKMKVQIQVILVPQ